VDDGDRRCTAVEMSTCRQQVDGDHPQSANRVIRPLSSAKRRRPQDPHV
jgi:hypothetical protein